MYHKLELIDPTRTDWRIRVRVTRMWSSFSSSGNFSGVNMILLDADNFHVHAFAPEAVTNYFVNDIIEGNAYDLQHFLVRQQSGRLRPITSDKLILFSILTSVMPVPLEAITIPRHKFELRSLAEIYEDADSYLSEEKPLYAIDIIGAAQNIRQPHIVNTPFGDKTILRFELYDGSNIVKVTAWDDKVHLLAPLFEGQFVHPPIVILSTVRARHIRASLHVSILTSSRVHTDPVYPAVTHLRDRLLAQHYAAPVYAP